MFKDEFWHKIKLENPNPKTTKVDSLNSMDWRKIIQIVKQFINSLNSMGGRKKNPICILISKRGRGNDGICRSLLL